MTAKNEFLYLVLVKSKMILFFIFYLGVDRARILPARAEPNEFLKIRAKTEPRSAGSASQCIAEPANLGSSRAELDFAEPITSRAKSEPGKTMARAESSRAMARSTPRPEQINLHNCLRLKMHWYVDSFLIYL